MKYIFTVMMCCFLFAAALYPQSVSGPDSLSLQQAISIALEKNLNIKIATKEIDKNNYVVDESNSSLLPVLSAQSHFLYAPPSGYDSTVTNGGEYGLQLSVDYTLYNGGLNHLLVNKAGRNVNLSELNLQKVKSELIFNVRTVFYNINHAMRGAEYQTENVKSLLNYLQFVKEQHSGGNASQSDILRTEVDLNNAKIKLEDEKLKLKRLKGQLFSLLFLPADTTVTVEKISESDVTIPPEQSPDNFIDVKIAEMQATINQLNIRTVSAEKLPVINLSGDAGVLGIKPENYNNDVGYSANINIRVPIFSWGAINARIDQASVTYEQSRLNAGLVKHNLIQVRDSLIAEFRQAEIKMKAYKNNVKTAEDNFYYSKALFIGGSGSTLEVLDAYRMLNDTKTNYNNSILAMQQVRAELLKLYGE
jgi:outer membrane protein